MISQDGRTERLLVSIEGPCTVADRTNEMPFATAKRAGQTGVFITLEGIDGAGKSTQTEMLASYLGERGDSVLRTREPGGSPGAEEIRALLVQGDPGRWSPETEILLFTAARRDHIERTVQPALARGEIVLCDRYVDSTRAYQGDGNLRAKVDLLHAQMIGRDADLTLIFDLDPERGLNRTTEREGLEDRFERKGLQFQKELRARFLEIAASCPHRCVVVDASRAVEEIASEVADIVNSRIAALRANTMDAG